MKINGIEAEKSPLRLTTMEHRLYQTVNGKVGGMCVDYAHLNWFVRELKKFGSYLEIGTFDGVALSVYAETYPEKKFVAIDSFEIAYATGNGHFEYFFENCKRLKNVSLWKGRSQEVLPHITDRFDMIFIDGAHDYKSVRRDYELTWPLLNKAGYLIFHDINLESTLQVVEEAEKEQNTKRHLTDVGVLFLEKING